MDALNVAELHDETVFLLANLYFNESDFEAVIRLEELLEEEHLLAQWLFAQAHKELENDAQAEALYTELLSTALTDNPDFLKDYVDFLCKSDKMRRRKPILNNIWNSCQKMKK